jgi:superfamily II DNA helicase RecQ
MCKFYHLKEKMGDTKTSSSIDLGELSSKVVSERKDINKLEERRENLENFESRLTTKENELYNNLNRFRKQFFRTGKTGTKIIATDNMLEKLPLDFSRIDNETKEKETNIEKAISSYLCETDA